ncbi:MAG TPA: divalent metal cation transporter [Fimbriimonas sp.]|nr:divalent metal cation transporter [Fimbriimonas sp.]
MHSDNEKDDSKSSTFEANRPRSNEDLQDVDGARLPEMEDEGKPWYKSIGPGLITGAADDDPSGIGTYSQCGASFGYGQLWLAPFCIPLMISVQEMCGRVALVTGEGIAAVLKDHYPRWLLYGSVALLFLANSLNVYADLNVMAASAKMLFGLHLYFWLTVLVLTIGVLEIFVPYRRFAGVLKFSCLALGAYFVVPFLRGSHNDWGNIASHLVLPVWKPNLDFTLAATAFLGTTISPYLFFWQAGETVEEELATGKSDEPGRRKQRVKESEIRNLRADTVLGMITSQLVAFFIIIATAGVLYRPGHPVTINSAMDAAQALRPLGPAAVWIFSIGMIGTGFLAIPTLAGSAAYAAAEAFGWRYGLFRRFRRAPGFYLTVLAVLLVGFLLNFFTQISPIKALVYSAVVNAIVAVPLLLVLLHICNNGKILGRRTNGIWSNVFGWASFVCMGAASAFFIWAVVSGKAS